MFHLEVLQNRWVFLGLFGGIVLVLAMVLTYVALWQPRPPGQFNQPDSRLQGWIPLRLAIPWFLILTYVGVVLYGILYVILVSTTPPNW